MSSVTDLATCPICCHLMLDARMLACGHTFCLSCTRCLLEVSDWQPPGFACPTCRSPCRCLPEQLPKNFAVSNIAEVLAAATPKEELDNREQPEVEEEEQLDVEEEEEPDLEEEEPDLEEEEQPGVEEEEEQPGVEEEEEQPGVEEEEEQPGVEEEEEQPGVEEEEEPDVEEVCSSDRGSEASSNIDVFEMDRPIRFHHICGSFTQVSEDGRSAERISEYCDNGLLLTNRPLNVDEVFEVKLESLTRMWVTNIELGVVSCNPDTLASLPSDLSEWRESPYFCLRHNSECYSREGEQYTVAQPISFNELRVGDRVGLRVTGDGDLHFHLNGEDRGVTASEVNGRWWGVVGLQGKVTKISIVEDEEEEDEEENPYMFFSEVGLSPGRFNREFLASPVVQLQSGAIGQLDDQEAEEQADSEDEEAREDGQTVETEREVEGEEADRQVNLSGAAAQTVESEEARERRQARVSNFRFHQNCGLCVKLQFDRGVTRRLRGGASFGVVMSDRPLLSDEIFEVRVDELLDDTEQGSIGIGVVSCDPDRLTRLPSFLSNFEDPEAVFLSGRSVCRAKETLKQEFLEVDLRELNEADRVGVSVTADGDLHAYVNGRHQGVAATGLQLPQWAALEIQGGSTVVTLQVDSTAH